MTRALHARLEPKNFESAPLQYTCLEVPCVTNGIVYLYEQLQRHAESFHNASAIDVDLTTARKNRT